MNDEELAEREYASSLERDYPDYVESLRRHEQQVGAGALADAMLAIPKELRDELAKGPVGYRYDCGVCDAFRKVLGRSWAKDCGDVLDLADPLVIVYFYHEVPKIRMRYRDDQHYGALANEVYVRCLDTYRAAGWRGEATPPNA